MIFYILGIMGSGKTMLATIYALEYSQLHPDSNIYANYHLKLPHFHYTPFMFLDFSNLHNCLIITDDFYALQNVKAFLLVMVNLSRKADIEIILTAQYYTMIPPQIRKLSNYKIECKYDKNNDILYSIKVDGNNNITFNQVKKAVEKTERIYDTREVVRFPTERNLLDEVVKYSKNQTDLDMNLELCCSNSTKRKQYLKYILNNYKLDFTYQ